MEQAKFAYSALGKAFEKQSKTIEDQGIEQVEALKAFKTRRSFKSFKAKRESKTRINWRTFWKIWELMKLKMK